jgi:branched-chain amino acid aminotransferase
MTETLKFTFERAATSRLSSVDFDRLPFGTVYTDHMFIAEYSAGEWRNSRIVPFAPLLINPGSPAIHYGQSIFEGIKAYRSPDDDILLFRPIDNWKRMNISAERMCMPSIPEDLFMDSLKELINVDRAWVPPTAGASLYVRPFMFSADEYIGIRPSQNFLFMVILCPVGPYYSAPVRVKIETHFTRAVEGGTGYAKAGGNYGGAIYPTKLAQEQGYQQLIWTDGKEHRYIEESGTMNVMFATRNTILTPALSDSILAGITRDSVLTLARSWGMGVEERRISVDEIVGGLREGVITEAFGVGTAATIAPISAIGFEGIDFSLPPVEKWSFAPKVFNALNDIKYGKTTNDYGWTVKI